MLLTNHSAVAVDWVLVDSRPRLLPGESAFSLMRRCLSLYIETLIFSNWWYLHSFSSAQTERPTQVAKDPQTPN